VNTRIGTFQLIGKLAISLIAVVLIQGILGYRLRVFGYFDLPLIITIYYGFTLNRPIPAVIIGTSVGLIQDTLAGVPLGTNGFSKTLIGYLAATTGSKFDVDLPVARAIAIFLFTLGDGIVVNMLSLVTGTASAVNYTSFALHWLVSGIFNALLGLLLFGIHDRVTHVST
jgi:rod shape-determining protein MreD